MNDYDGPRGDVRVRETILRVVLQKFDVPALYKIVDEWLRSKTDRANYELPMSEGRSSIVAQGITLHLDRAAERLVAHLDERDSRVVERRWITDIVVDYALAMLDVRIVVEQPLGASLAPRQTPNFFAKASIDLSVGLIDVVPLQARSLVVLSPNVMDLVALIFDPNRELPVVVVSLPNVVNADDLARRLVGAAHVRTIDRDASFVFTSEIGKFLSVFDGGIRVYPPHFSRESRAFDAPLWLGQRLADVHTGMLPIERIVRVVLAQNVTTFATRPLTTINDIDQKMQDAHSDKEPATHEEITRLRIERDEANLEISILQAKLDSAKEAEDILFGQAQQIENDAADQLEELRNAKALAAHWRNLLNETRAANNDRGLFNNEVAPRDVDEFVFFVRDRYQGRIYITPAARRFYKNGKFENFAVLTKILDAIAIDYYRMATGVPDSQSAWKKRCNELHMKHGLSATQIGATSDHRMQVNGKSEIMYHVRSKGTSYDPQRMLYVGFIYDDSADQIMIGRLPSKPETMADGT